MHAAERLYDIVEKVTKIERNEKVIFAEDSLDKYILNNVLNFTLAKAIHEWTCGKSFIEIC